MSSSWQNWSKRLVSLVSPGRGRLRKTKRNRAGLGHRAPERLHLEPLERRDLLTGFWTLLTHNAPNGVATMLLLSDGTVMAQQAGPGLTSPNWSRLAPDISGNFVNGSWSALRSMALARLYYASNVLPNGNVFLVGGEYSGPQGAQNWTNTGEMYNSLANTWTNIANFPQSQFGDDPSAMLPDGRVLAGYLSGPQTYIYNPTTNTWSFAANKLRNDNSDEETWVKLPDNSILSYDVCVNDPVGCSRGHAQRYIPSTNTWVDAGNAPNNLSNAAIGYELGPAFRLPDGRVFQLGGTSNTAFYTPATNTWVAGPAIPGGRGADDAPGAVLPNGNILFAADTPKFIGPTRIYEFNPNTNTYTDVTPAGFNLTTDGVGGNPGACYHTRMLVLPTGQVLLSNESNQLDVYTPDGLPNAAWRPVITSLSRGGSTVTLTGTQLNGLSEGASYGDDAEMSSNYPLVQLHNAPFVGSPYLRTSNWSSTGVATGSTPVSVQFALGTGLDVLLSVAANGISTPFALAIEMSPSVNNILLRVDPNNSADLEILNNGSFFDDVPFTSFTKVLVTCDSSTDTLTVDYHFGNPIPPGGLNYQDGSGVDTLTVNDQSTTSSQTWTLGANSVLRSGSSPITYSDGINFVNINGGSGANTYNINGTETFFTTTLHTGIGGDTVNVRGTSGPLVISGDGGGETINVGSQAPNLSGTLTAITAPVTVTNTGSTSTLSVDDSGDATGRTGTVSGTAVTGLGMGSSAAVNYTGGQQLASLTVRGGSGANTVTVTGTSTPTTLHTGNNGSSTVNVKAAASSLTVDGDLGGPTVNVGSQAPNLNGTLSAITAPVTVTDVSSGALSLDDSGDSTARTGTISSTAVTGFGMGSGGSVTYYDGSSMVHLTSLTVRSGSGANTVTVTGTSTATTVHTGSSGNSSTVNVKAASAPLTIDGDSSPVTINIGSQAPNLNGTLANITAAVTVTNTSAPTSALNLDDSGDTTARTGTITGTAVTGLGMPSGVAVNYTGSQLASLTVRTGSGGAAVTASGTSTSTSVVGNASGTNTLLGPNADTTWNLTGSNAGSIPSLNLSYSAFQNLTGGSAADTFVFSAGATESGTINGGGGANALNCTAYTTPVMVNLAAGTASGVGGFANVQSFTGGSAANTLGGPNAATTWNLTGSNAGTVTGGYSFAAFQNLTGGASDNAFVFSDGAGVSGAATGGAGTNTLDYSLYSTPVSVNVQAGTATGVGSFANFPNFIGGGAANTLAGPDAATTWNIAGSNAGNLSGGYTFTLFQSLTGGAGDNTFVCSDGATLSGTLTGGGGNNTLDTSAYSSSESFSITGANAGTASVVPVFSGIQNLVGGSAATTFSLSDGGSLSGTVNGGSGTATLDYSNGWSGTVLVDLQIGLASGVNGGVSNILNVNGANGNGAVAYNLLIGNGGNWLQGGTGRSNILVAGGSASTLLGGDSNDLLIGGTTSYDSDPNLAAWQQIAAYWAGTDGNSDDPFTRANNLEGVNGGNGVPQLTNSTVFGNNGNNTMTGTGELALIYSNGADNINGFDPNSPPVYGISP